MTDSLSLITAQITILDSPLTLIRIPISYYSLFVQPILRLLFGNAENASTPSETDWVNRHEFLNISITPIEVSIICREDLVQKYIEPVEQAIASLRGPNAVSSVAEVAREGYTVIQVDGEGLNAGQRVLELTGPLAMAGISIFFITTYFSDYIVLPSRAKRTVTVALEQRGFVFSRDVDAFISQLSPSLYHHEHPRSDYLSSGGRSHNLGDAHHLPSAPTTPPAKDIDELQMRTFKKLRTYKIQPIADKDLRLVFCAGSQESSQTDNAQLRDDLLQVLLSTSPMSPHPAAGDNGTSAIRFLSITTTSHEPVSILLEQRLLPYLERSLVGAKEDVDVLIPIIFDLQQFGFDTTGIIGGVAGRLGAQGYLPDAQEVSPSTSKPDTPAEIDISFLSTAKAGTVMVRAEQLDFVLRELQKGYAVEN